MSTSTFETTSVATTPRPGTVILSFSAYGAEIVIGTASE